MSSKDKLFVSPLARARGLGSTHEGAHHWMQERLTSVALLPLTLWVVYSIVSLRGAAYTDFVTWILQPWNAVLLLVFMLISFYHAVLGLQVVIEDYVSCHATKLAMLIGVKFAFGLMALFTVFSILKLSL